MNIDNLSVGCIGCGNMGAAILGGLSKDESLSLMGYDPKVENLPPLQAVGVVAAKDMEDLAIHSNTIVIAVKPYLVKSVLQQIAPVLTPDKIVISIAAGVSMKSLQEGVQGKCAVIRCMPNTPALVGAGIFAFCCEDPKLCEEKKEFIFSLFNKIGLCIDLPEGRFSGFSALIGSGPAYVFHFMNALVQAGVTFGFSRYESRNLVEKLFAGSVRMSKASTLNFTELRDNVCSPAGLTIAGINHMDRNAVSGHIVDAVLAAEIRAKEMED